MGGTLFAVLLMVAVAQAVSPAARQAERLPHQRKLELRGQLEPPARAAVSLYGAITPFMASTASDANGRFRFRNLAPGAYTVSVTVPGRGEIRQTIEVGPSLADSEGRVSLTIPFQPSAVAASEAIERKHGVSVRQLRIPDRAQREYQQAQQKLSERDVAGAIRRLERAVELAPHFVEVWNHLGTIAYQSSRYPEAEKYFRKALEQDPGAYSPLVNLGGVLLNLKRYPEALAYNKEAVRLRPDDALAQSQLGMNYFALGEEEQALKHLTTAKNLDPAHFSQPQLLLAEIYLRRNDRAAAIRELEDYLARHPDAPDAGAVRRGVEKLKRP